MAEQLNSPLIAFLVAGTGQNRHKGLGKSPFGNRRRNKLGIRKATLKASVMALAPKVAAIKSSRAKPVTRETKVHKETVEADLNKDTPQV